MINIIYIWYNLKECLQSKIFCITSISILFFTEETTINGYRIPRRTIVVANLWTINNDSLLYSESSKFYPKRFIDENGKRAKTEGPYPFGVGMYANLIQILAKVMKHLFVGVLGQSSWCQIVWAPVDIISRKDVAFLPFPRTTFPGDSIKGCYNDLSTKPLF